MAIHIHGLLRLGVAYHGVTWMEVKTIALEDPETMESNVWILDHQVTPCRRY